MLSRHSAIVSLLAVMVLMAGGCQSGSRWAGTWQGPVESYGGTLESTVKQIDDENWEASFTGYCNRAFAYEITMKGQRRGDEVVFEGEADLGEPDGGLYQWTGHLAGDEFTGEYSSTQGKQGSFTMARQR